MRLPLFQVDAFTSRVFQGNPAAVCPLERWLPDKTLQAIARENNLSETAFLVPEGDGWAIRWFTPTVEVELCGHATLASAFVVFGHLAPGTERVTFGSRSGPLTVVRRGDLLCMDFPALPVTPAAATPELLEALGHRPLEVWKGRSYLVLYRTEDEVRALAPDLERVRRLDVHAVIVTAPATTVDFVSRFFAPAAGVPEDPVTGSAHCALVPFWAARLGRSRLHALQVSTRGGELFCEDRGDRVEIAGRAVQYLEGTIEL